MVAADRHLCPGTQETPAKARNLRARGGSQGAIGNGNAMAFDGRRRRSPLPRFPEPRFDDSPWGVASVRGKIERTVPPHRPAKKPSQARDPLPRRISRANPDSRGKMLAGSSGRFQSRFEFGNLRCTTLLRGQWPGNAIACPRGKIMPKQARSPPGHQPGGRETQERLPDRRCGHR